MELGFVAGFRGGRSVADVARLLVVWRTYLTVLPLVAGGVLLARAHLPWRPVIGQLTGRDNLPSMANGAGEGD